MADSILKACPECRQQLRIPKNIGGVVMACPSCGHQFHSDFKIGGAPECPVEEMFETSSLLDELG